MDELTLLPVAPACAAQIEDYRDEFVPEGKKLTCHENRIPGMDYLEDHKTVADWLAFCETQAGMITWYMAVRPRDGKVVGFCCLRHRLEYDDDDPDFASHIGYSVRPSERRKGCAKQILRLALQKAAELGIESARLICSDENTASNRAILANGGVLLDSIYGEESGITVNRYDVPTHF